jgi:hypothetical protein
MPIRLRIVFGVVVLSATAVLPLHAQQRPVPRADSVERARADSAAAVRASLSQRAVPDVGAVGDVVANLSSDRSGPDNLNRIAVREVELGVQAPINRRFRGDAFIRFSNLQGVSVEQAYLTVAGMSNLELRLGRYLMPFGQQNTVHRHDLHTIEYPWVLQQFFSSGGLKGTGLSASASGKPLGWYTEVIATVVDRLGETPSGLRTAEPVNEDLEGLGYAARLRNYWDVGGGGSFELSGSVITGLIEQPLTGTTGSAPNAVSGRQSTFGADLIYRWRSKASPNSFILQGEVMRQVNDQFTATLPGNIRFAGPVRDATGGYLLGRFEVSRGFFLVARGDYVENAFTDDESLSAGSGYVEYRPSAFTKFVAGYERVSRTGVEGANRLLLQASFTLGAHPSHPF